MQNATHTGKHRTKRCEMQRSTRFCSAARRLGHLFAIKHRKNRCESKSKVQFRVSKVPKLEFQHMPAKESHHPTGRQMRRLPTTTAAAATTATTTATTVAAAVTTSNSNRNDYIIKRNSKNNQSESKSTSPNPDCARRAIAIRLFRR